MSEELGRWFKVYAAITDHPVFSDSQALRAFLWCIRRACWKRTYSHGKWIPRGSFWCGNRDAATECHSSINTWRQAMAKLVELELVTIETTATHTLVTIVNYGKYQGDESGATVSKIDTPTDTHTDTRGDTHTDTRGDTHTDTRSETPTDTRSRSTRTDRSVENTPAAAPPGDSPDKPVKPKATKTAYDPLAEPIPPSLDTTLFRQAWAAWAAHRSEIKARLTPQSTKQQIRLLVELGHDKAVETIRTSIRQSWRGLFPEQPKHNPQQRQFKLLNDPIKGVTPDMGVRRKANP